MTIQVKDYQDKINAKYWVIFNRINICFYSSCGFKEPLFVSAISSTGETTIDNFGVKEINGSYMAHIWTTHGFPPFVLVEEIANKLYLNKEDRQKMLDKYEYLDR